MKVTIRNKVYEGIHLIESGKGKVDFYRWPPVPLFEGPADAPFPMPYIISAILVVSINAGRKFLIEEGDR